VVETTAGPDAVIRAVVGAALVLAACAAHSRQARVERARAWAAFLERGHVEP
jgi:hypothetical protein